MGPTSTPMTVRGGSARCSLLPDRALSDTSTMRTAIATRTWRACSEILIPWCSVQQIAGQEKRIRTQSDMPRSSPSLAVSQPQQQQLEQWLAAMGTPQQVALRCRIVLAAGCGRAEVQIASELRI